MRTYAYNLTVGHDSPQFSIGVPFNSGVMHPPAITINLNTMLTPRSFINYCSQSQMVWSPQRTLSVMQSTGCLEKKWSKICILHPNAHRRLQFLHFTPLPTPLPGLELLIDNFAVYRKVTVWSLGFLVLVNNCFIYSRHFITSFCGRLPHYL